MLAVSPRTVWRLKAEGLLPFVPLRGLIRFDLEDVRILIEGQKERVSWST